MSKDKRIWIKLAVEFPNSPKIAGLSDHGFRALVEMLCYCREHLTDGFLHRRVVQRFWPDAIAELTSNDPDQPSLIAVEDGWQLHDYLDHQESRAEVEARSERLAANGRKGGRPRKNQVANQVGNQVAKQVAKQNETNLPSKTKAESESESESDMTTLMVTNSCQSSYVTRARNVSDSVKATLAEIGIEWAAWINTLATAGIVLRHDTDCVRLAQHLLGKTTQTIENPTGYVVACVRRNPLEVRTWAVDTDSLGGAA